MSIVKRNPFLCGTGRFFGWGIVFGCIIGVAGGSGPLIISSASVFMETLNNEFGWSRSEIAFSITVYTIVTAFLMPFVGRIIDKVGVYKLVVPAILLSGIAVSLLSFMTELWQFYLFVAIFSVAGAATTSLPYVRVVSLWFDRRRGLFLGLVAAGIGLGFAVLPPVMQYLLELFGWRMAYVGIGVTIIVVILPIILLFVRDNPADYGLMPDGDEEGALSDSASVEVGVTLSEAMKTVTFWKLLVATLVFSFVFNGMTLHLVPLLKDNGLGASQAVLLASVMGASLFIARIIIGTMLDKFFAPKLAVTVFLIGAGGIALVALNLSLPMNTLAAAMIGVGIGAETDIISYMTSRYFGLRHFGKIYGFLFSFFYIGTGLGPLVLGIAYETNGNYNAMLYIYVALCVPIILTFFSFGPYVYKHNNAPEDQDSLGQSLKSPSR